jgi:hypothetical protein
MDQLAIRCHASSPVVSAEVDEWLREEVERLRENAPHAALRLLRLSQAVPAGKVDVGWLIEVDSVGGEPPLDADGLTHVVRDLRMLGLQPTVLHPAEGGAVEDGSPS